MSNEGSVMPSVLRLEQIMEEGNKALNKKKWEEAIKLFDIATDMKPQYVDGWLGKAAACKGKNDLATALEHFRTSLEIDPRNLDAWNGLIELLHELKRYTEEIGACEFQLRIFPRSEEPILKKGVALTVLGKFDEALDCFNQLLERRPENISALNNKGAVLVEMGKLEDALDVFDTALVHEPHNSEVQRNRCLLLMRVGRYSEAVRIAGEMLAVHENALFWMLKGLAHAELREVPLALKSLEKARDLDPELDGLDEALERVRRLNDALQDVEEGGAKIRVLKEGEAEELASYDQASLSPRGMAVILNYLGFPTESLRLWKDSLNRNNVDDWIGLGRALFAGGERTSGERCLKEALKLDAGAAVRAVIDDVLTDETDRAPKIDLIDLNASEAPLIWRETDRLLSAGKVDDAIDLLNNVLKSDKNMEWGWNWLGVLNASNSRHAHAEDAFRHAIKINSQHATFWSNFGATFLTSGKLRQALAVLKKATEIDPNHVEALHNLGAVEFQLGRDNEARKLLRRASKIETRPETLHVLAKIAEKNNKWKDAVHCYEQILKLDSKNTAVKTSLGKAKEHLSSGKKSTEDSKIKSLTKIPGVGPKRAKTLIEAGYSSLKLIEDASEKELEKLPGFNHEIVKRLKNAISDQMRKKGKPEKPPEK